MTSIFINIDIYDFSIPLILESYLVTKNLLLSQDLILFANTLL